MKKIAVITATRAEYGLLIPLIRRITEDAELELCLIVTGTHLSDKYGCTINAIRKDGFLIAHEIPILEDGNTSFDISLTMANATKGFAACFRDDRPDMVVILGDRTEMLGVAVAAMNERIPIAHIHGGEVTEGAVDDCIRHALTKISYLHFTSAEVYRKRVIQMGESPERVFHVGALGLENIKNVQLFSRKELEDSIGVGLGKEYAVVTFHPETLEENTAESQVEEICAAMEARSEIFFLITAANADAGGENVNRLFMKYVEKCKNACFVYNLGTKFYLSAIKNAAFVLGNSSSGIYEAPALGVPTINIGNRQKGRLMAESVINCIPKREEIMRAMEKAEKSEHFISTLFGDGKTSEKIVKTIKVYLMKKNISLKKGFYEVKEQ